MIPIVYLMLIIPLEYALELYAKYELLFLRMTFKEEKDKKIIAKNIVTNLAEIDKNLLFMINMKNKTNV